jgi:hypothetical protein
MEGGYLVLRLPSFLGHWYLWSGGREGWMKSCVGLLMGKGGGEGGGRKRPTSTSDVVRVEVTGDVDVIFGVEFLDELFASVAEVRWGADDRLFLFLLIPVCRRCCVY